MRLLGITLLVATCLLVFLRYDHISFWSAGIGITLGAGLFLALITSKSEEPPAPPEQQNNPWHVRFLDLQAQTNQTIDSLNTEGKKLQQKLFRAEERCTSYQKLVDVHQGEIDQLKREGNQLGLQVIENDRKITELQLAKLEPDLFDTEKRQTESSYRELRKQFEEKSQALEQTRIRLFRVESELLLLQKEKEEQSRQPDPAESTLIHQLRQTEDEKKKLEAELASLQQIVSELSLSRGKTTRKKVAKEESESHDLLG
jgi:chromosome segregation ATPase